jgi:hypothetical protein
MSIGKPLRLERMIYSPVLNSKSDDVCSSSIAPCCELRNVKYNTRRVQSISRLVTASSPRRNCLVQFTGLGGDARSWRWFLFENPFLPTASLANLLLVAGDDPFMVSNYKLSPYYRSLNLLQIRLHLLRYKLTRVQIKPGFFLPQLALELDFLLCR